MRPKAINDTKKSAVMPHIRIEYTTDTVTQRLAQSVLKQVVTITKDSGLFHPAHIKARLLPIEDYYIGEQSAGFIHIECRTHPGKRADQKKQLVDAWVKSLSETMPVAVVTAEVTETDRQAYAKETTQIVE